MATCRTPALPCSPQSYCWKFYLNPNIQCLPLQRPGPTLSICRAHFNRGKIYQRGRVMGTRGLRGNIRAASGQTLQPGLGQLTRRKAGFQPRACPGSAGGPSGALHATHVWGTLGYQSHPFLYHQTAQSRSRHMKEGEGVSNTYGLTAFCEATAWSPPCQVGSQPHMAVSQTDTRVLVLGRFQRWVGDRLVAAMVGSQLRLGPRAGRA